MKKIYQTDPWLEPYAKAIEARHERILAEKRKLAGDGPLGDAANNHLYYGLHHTKDGWVIREWAPNASRIYLIGDFNNWKRTPDYALQPVGSGNWELRLGEMFLSHGCLYKLWIEWPGGGGERIPAYATRVVQDPETKVFCAQVWDPVPYEWKHRTPGKRPHPLIYECHIGMSGEKEGVSTFDEFRTNVLPRVKRLGYDTLQIMALQEHPYYGSFGYQVSSFFALSSRFGTPEEFKRLVDEAHAAGIAVIMDIVHSHAVGNEAEGLGKLDGDESLYFYKGDAGHHPAWGTRCFDYGKDEVKYFLLSNCKYWMQEYHLDGFRFDGVTSMLYWNHGLGADFGDYALYFNEGVDENAVCYLGLANMLIHELNPKALTIDEDVSALRRAVEHGRHLVGAYQQARRRKDGQLRRVPRPGLGGRQDHHFPPDRQRDVLQHAQRPAQSDSGQGSGAAQAHTPGHCRHLRRRLSDVHGERIRTSRVDRLPARGKRLVVQTRQTPMVNCR